MSSPDGEATPLYLCKYIRMRDEQIPPLSDPNYVRLVHPTTQYYCNLTFEAIGPDDDGVCPEECGPDRECFLPRVEAP